MTTNDITEPTPFDPIRHIDGEGGADEPSTELALTHSRPLHTPTYRTSISRSSNTLFAHETPAKEIPQIKFAWKEPSKSAIKKAEAALQIQKELREPTVRQK